MTKIDTIQTSTELIRAVEATFDPGLPVSPAFIFSTRIKLKDLARDLGCFEEVNGLIEEYSRDFKDNNYCRDIARLCDANFRGDIMCTANNFLTIMLNDPAYKNLRLNELSGRCETADANGNIRLWTDADDAASRTYIEKEYGIHSVQKHSDALACLFSQRKYHPVKQIIEAIKWDGEDRIEHVLTKWLKVEDSEYTREVSRLIFAGGIHRLYNPGCKFEDMAVLIGKQGGGKSSFIQFLAIEDRFFKELKTIEGKEALETIEGGWIVEVAELLALTKTKEQEAVKAFLSCQVDNYRPAYGRHTVEKRRTCAFVGTSNRGQFIADKTGARRFYPVECYNIGYDLFDCEQECREYLKQCWAEALHKMHTPFMNPYADRKIKPQIEEAQASATEDDYRVGMIQTWLDNHTEVDYVCGAMLWERILEMDLARFPKADQIQMGLIMDNCITGWQKCNPGRTKTFQKYGRQRYWTRKSEGRAVITCPTPNEFTPF